MCCQDFVLTSVLGRPSRVKVAMGKVTTEVGLEAHEVTVGTQEGVIGGKDGRAG